MRCKNCGWENPANNAKCEKCNAPIKDSASEPVDNNSSGKFDLKKTAKGCPECGYPIRDAEKTCPHCGYIFVSEKQEAPAYKEPAPQIEQQSVPEQAPDIPKSVEKICPFCKAAVAETAHYCSNCGVSLTNERKNLDGTIKPWVDADNQIQTPECSLTIISSDEESKKHSSLRFSGDVIQLNRGNTEPANQTITSKTQAELSFDNGKWYLQDKSALKTTYIYAGDKVELKPGDVIMLGNRSFKFDCV